MTKNKKAVKVSLRRKKKNNNSTISEEEKFNLLFLTDLASFVKLTQANQGSAKFFPETYEHQKNDQ